jgi:hypothetical protein
MNAGLHPVKKATAVKKAVVDPQTVIDSFSREQLVEALAAIVDVRLKDTLTYHGDWTKPFKTIYQAFKNLEKHKEAELAKKKKSILAELDKKLTPDEKKIISFDVNNY